VQESDRNAKVGFSKAVPAGWIQRETSSEGGARVFRKVHILPFRPHYLILCIQYPVNVCILVHYCSHMQVDTVRDNVQTALHAISSGNAEKVPIEQRKDLKRRNLINNV